jgi:hypothetical protein
MTEKKANRIESSPRKPGDFTPLAPAIHCFVRNSRLTAFASAVNAAAI